MREQRLAADPEKLSEAREFLAGFSSVILGSVTDHGHPHASYAPFIIDRGHFYVYVSGLAQHASTLKNRRASLLLIEDEEKARTIFARRRLTIDCRTRALSPQAADYDRLLDRMQDQHGSTVELLRTLPDFVLFELTPTHAQFVTGFGAAFELTPRLDRLFEPDGQR